MEDRDWVDENAGPMVRPYTLTRGRTKISDETLDLVAFVVSVVSSPPPGVALQPEHRAALELCRTPLSVVDVASKLDLPVGVVRILLGDLLRERLLILHEPAFRGRTPDENILREVLNGLKAL